MSLVDANLDASVVVCTRNRSRSLAQALDRLLQLEYPEDRWELIVVDNGSTDDTLAVAREVASTQPERVVVLEEPEPGLSISRNRGIARAHGQVVAFIDDDAIPEPDWLRGLLEILSTDGVSVAGGPVVPMFRGQPPAWLTERYLPYLAAWDRGSQVHDLTYNEYPRGVNIAFDRRVFDDFGGFSPHLGRKGRSLLSCEEIEICLRVERAGGRIVYAPRARVHHLTEAERITPGWLARRFGAQGQSEAILVWQHAGWRGLRIGLRSSLRNAVTTLPFGRSSEKDPLYVRCQWRTLLGFLRGSLRAPWQVPRYRPRTPVFDWLPFG